MLQICVCVDEIKKRKTNQSIIDEELGPRKRAANQSSVLSSSISNKQIQRRYNQQNDKIIKRARNSFTTVTTKSIKRLLKASRLKNSVLGKDDGCNNNNNKQRNKTLTKVKPVTTPDAIVLYDDNANNIKRTLPTSSISAVLPFMNIKIPLSHPGRVGFLSIGKTNKNDIRVYYLYFSIPIQ